MLDPRRITGLLRAHSEIDEIDDDLDMALRLHGATHHTETHPRFSILRDERGDDRMEWPFVRRINVQMPAREREQFAAILKGESEPVRNHP